MNFFYFRLMCCLFVSIGMLSKLRYFGFWKRLSMFNLISDLKETNQLVLLSGVLSIWIGDSAASIVGSKFGRIRFPGTSKKLEGTLASILAQIIFVCFVTNLNFFVVLSILFVAFVEALTTQVDNVILPIILYSLLTLVLWLNKF